MIFERVFVGIQSGFELFLRLRVALESKKTGSKTRLGIYSVAFGQKALFNVIDAAEVRN